MTNPLRNQFIIFTSLLMLTACGPRRTPINVFLEQPDTLVFEGSMSKEANERIFKLYKNAKVKPQILKISSGGGDVDLGMDLGDWVFRNHLDVEVVHYCLSSCANYVFTAARKKILNPDSMLFWHGGAHQPDIEVQFRKLGVAGKASWEAWIAREDAFFKTIGVNSSVTTYGQTAKHVVRTRTASGYDYSIEDMQKFGITNILEKDGPWRWRELRPENAFVVDRIEVRLPVN